MAYTLTSRTTDNEAQQMMCVCEFENFTYFPQRQTLVYYTLDECYHQLERLQKQGSVDRPALETSADLHF